MFSAKSILVLSGRLVSLAHFPLVIPNVTPFPPLAEFECSLVSVFLFTCSVLGSVLNLLVASVYIQKSPKCTYEIFVLFLAFINLWGCSGLIIVEYWFIFSSFDTCNNPPDFTTQVNKFASFLLYPPTQ